MPFKFPERADHLRQRDFGPDKFAEIPPHGRWQHFDVGGVARVAALLDEWKAQGCDELELTRRLIDLFFVSVLLDAGAGDVWKFKEPGTGSVYNRSEGIAVASLYMFKAGAFGSAAGVDGTVQARRAAFSSLTITRSWACRPQGGCFRKVFSDFCREPHDRRDCPRQAPAERRIVTSSVAQNLWAVRSTWQSRW